MDDERERALDEWDESWEGHHRRQLTYALAATPAQRLAWLEQAIELAYRAGALPIDPTRR